MRLATLPCVLFLLTAPALRADDKAQSIELKDFKFKVPENLANLFGHNEGEGKLFFYTNGAAEAALKVAADGEYEIVIKASGDAAQNERAKFKVLVDGEMVGKETELSSDDAKDYTFTTKLKSGDRKVKIEFTNDVFKENEFDRNLYVHAVSVKKK